MFRSFALAAPVAAAALVLTAGAAQAQAEDFQSNGRTTEVYHGDLDLSDPADQKLLRSRISRAALRVCRTNDAAALRDCRAKAIAHVEAPVTAAIARAETSERYADASGDAGKEVRTLVGN